MATKTAEEIVQAHKRTIEVFTGLECTIILTDKTQSILKSLTLTEILLTCEKFNSENFSIISNTVNREVVKLRKIFCLLANRAGYSANKIGQFLEKRDHTTITYNIRTGNDLNCTSPDFKRLYNCILTELVTYGQKDKQNQ